MLGISLKRSWLAELLLSTCPALKNSVLPVLLVVETFTDDEPAGDEFVRLNWKTRGRKKSNTTRMLMETHSRSSPIQFFGQIYHTPLSYL